MAVLFQSHQASSSCVLIAQPARCPLSVVRTVTVLSRLVVKLWLEAVAYPLTATSTSTSVPGRYRLIERDYDRCITPSVSEIM